LATAVSTAPNDLRAIAAWALEFVPDGGVVGLGTGHAAAAFIHALGERVRNGLRVRGVPTSRASDVLARRLGIPLATLDEVDAVDVDVDGADEVDPQCDLIKGYGSALVREKIVAASARRLVILVGPEKLVPVLGSHGKLPVEVVPFGLALCRRELSELGCAPELRTQDGKPLVTDNGNFILDCRVETLTRPRKLERAIRTIPGVVGTGLFLGMAHTVLIQHGSEIEVRHRSGT
jgi:ribose 5-phosphate isomerase A